MFPKVQIFLDSLNMGTMNFKKFQLSSIKKIYKIKN